MIKRKVFLEIGILDEAYSPGFCEDISFCAKARENGFDILDVRKKNGGFPLSHLGEGTFHSPEWKEKFEKIVCRNEGYLIRKYDHLQEKKTVHVIVPTYNRNKNLCNLLAYIECQTHRDIIVHVISDGPNEIAKRIVEEFNGDIKFEYSCLPEHEGNFGSLPRIKALENLPDGDLVVFIDDDNIVKENYIEMLLNPFRRNNPNLVMSMCQIQHNLCGVIPQKQEVVFGQIDSLNIMVKTEIAKKHRGKWMQIGEKIDHDFKFIEACSKEGEFYLVPEILGSHK
jgi:hypothetical protein